MLSCNHPNLVHSYGATIHPPRVGIVMEFCEKGEVLVFMDEYRRVTSEGYRVAEKLRILMEISNGVSYLHERKILHRDLKSENILMTKEERPKLIDFGLSRMIERISIVRTQRIGTSFYMAPEVAQGSFYDEKCDVFSFAILVFVLFAEEMNPYFGEVEDCLGIELKVANDGDFRPNMDLLRDTLKEDGDPVEEWEWLMELITKNWSGDPKERNSFKEISVILREKLNELAKGEDDSEDVDEEF